MPNMFVVIVTDRYGELAEAVFSKRHYAENYAKARQKHPERHEHVVDVRVDRFAVDAAHPF